MITEPVSLSTKKGLDLPRLLLIHTGGTFAMKVRKGSLVPRSLSDTIAYTLEECQHFSVRLDLCAFFLPVDSSHIQPSHWQALASCISTQYENYDGFVIIHGTDTMAYTASALSFMLEGLTKPVVLTGAQIPVGYPRSDASTNLLGALEVATTTYEGQPFLQEVGIFFGGQLLRGNRSTKHSTQAFSAYRSYNYPPLAAAERQLVYDPLLLFRPKSRKLRLHLAIDTSVAVLQLFPGISEAYLSSILQTKSIRGLLLLSYGVGNGPKYTWFYERLRAAIEKNLCVVSISQCRHGNLQPKKYLSSVDLFKASVISCRDMTYEAALTKLMCLLGRYKNVSKVKENMNISLSGEICT